MKGELCPQDQYTTQPLQATGSQAQQGQASSSNNTDSRAGSSSTGSNSSGSSNTSSRWRSKAGDEAFWLRQRSALLSLPLTDGYGGRAGAGAAAEDQGAAAEDQGEEPPCGHKHACSGAALYSSEQLYKRGRREGWEGVCHTKQGRRSSEGCCIWGTECALLYAVYGHSRFGCFRDTAGLNAYGHSRLGCLRDSAGLGAYGTQQTWVLMGHSRLGCLRDAAGLGAATHG
eukprot:1161197-Pelagomonas_calceolata.AAC.5